MHFALAGLLITNLATVVALVVALADARRERRRRDGREDTLIERLQRPHLVPTSPETDEDAAVLVLHADDDAGYAKARGLG